MEQPAFEDIKKIWDERAQAYRDDSRASMPDRFLIELEIRTLAKQLSEHDKILDIGCANGYTDMKIAGKRNVKIIAIDNSQAMIDAARRVLSERALNDQVRERVSFEVDDIFSPDFEGKYTPQHFNKVLTKRVLINIPTWEGQQCAIEKIYNILDEGGMYIMMESTLQGYEKISRMRERFGIERTKIRWHNNYFDEDRLIPFLKERFDIERISNFSSTYYVGSRVVQPVLLRCVQKEPSYDFFLNRVFAHIPSFGDQGIQKMFILKKKRA